MTSWAPGKLSNPFGGLGEGEGGEGNNRTGRDGFRTQPGVCDHQGLESLDPSALVCWSVNKMLFDEVSKNE